MGLSIRTGLIALIAGAPVGALADDLAQVVVKTADAREIVFTAEVADEEHERNRGLMWRRSLADDAGMLFLYPSPREVHFWMRNTLIPLDMIFIREDCTIARIEEEAEPLTLDSRSSEAPVLAVLEVRGGLSREIGAAAGDCVTWTLSPEER